MRRISGAAVADGTQTHAQYEKRHHQPTDGKKIRWRRTAAS